MFGYIKVERSELRVREYEYYRACYCGLCRRMGRCTGQCSRAALNYDFVFLCHVRLLLTGENPDARRHICPAHLIHRRTMLERCATLDYAARAAALLAYEKCRDDVADERGFRRMRARLRCWFLSSAFRRARRALPDLSDAVRQKLAALAEYERQRRPGVDEPAALFGAVLAEIFGYGLPEEKARIARDVGQRVGHFIYIADAADDMKEDEKSGNFNPVLALYGAMPDEEQKKGMEDALLLCLSDLEKTFDLLGDGENPAIAGVLKNILYLGMPAAVRRVLYGEGRRKEEDREP